MINHIKKVRFCEWDACFDVLHHTLDNKSFDVRWESTRTTRVLQCDFNNGRSVGFRLRSSMGQLFPIERENCARYFLSLINFSNGSSVLILSKIAFWITAIRSMLLLLEVVGMVSTELWNGRCTAYLRWTYLSQLCDFVSVFYMYRTLLVSENCERRYSMAGTLAVCTNGMLWCRPHQAAYSWGGIQISKNHLPSITFIPNYCVNLYTFGK